MTTQAKTSAKSPTRRFALGSNRSVRPGQNREVEKTKLAVRTADAIERRIVENRLQPDSYIGSEAELLEEYHVSRAVLREAILILEQRQIALRRRGVRGGVLARRPDVSSVARSVALYLECSGVGAEHLLDARKVLEEHCARLAAEGRDKAKLAELREHLLTGLEMEGEAARRQMGQFHVLLAQLSGNPVWSLFTEVLIDVAVELTRRSSRGPSEAALKRQFRNLIAVVDAIDCGDGDAAAKGISDYLEDVTRRYSTGS